MVRCALGRRVPVMICARFMIVSWGTDTREGRCPRLPCPNITTAVVAAVHDRPSRFEAFAPGGRPRQALWLRRTPRSVHGRYAASLGVLNSNEHSANILHRRHSRFGSIA